MCTIVSLGAGSGSPPFLAVQTAQISIGEKTDGMAYSASSIGPVVKDAKTMPLSQDSPTAQSATSEVDAPWVDISSKAAPSPGMTSEQLWLHGFKVVMSNAFYQAPADPDNHQEILFVPFEQRRGMWKYKKVQRQFEALFKPYLQIEEPDLKSFVVVNFGFLNKEVARIADHYGMMYQDVDNAFFVIGEAIEIFDAPKRLDDLKACIAAQKDLAHELFVLSKVLSHPRKGLKRDLSIFIKRKEECQSLCMDMLLQSYERQLKDPKLTVIVLPNIFGQGDIFLKKPTGENPEENIKILDAKFVCVSRFFVDYQEFLDWNIFYPRKKIGVIATVQSHAKVANAALKDRIKALTA